MTVADYKKQDILERPSGGRLLLNYKIQRKWWAAALPPQRLSPTLRYILYNKTLVRLPKMDFDIAVCETEICVNRTDRQAGEF